MPTSHAPNPADPDAARRRAPHRAAQIVAELAASGQLPASSLELVAWRSSSYYDLLNSSNQTGANRHPPNMFAQFAVAVVQGSPGYAPLRKRWDDAKLGQPGPKDGPLLVTVSALRPVPPLLPAAAFGARLPPR